MIDVTLQQLRVLREVAASGTMAAAADSLGYTPSAISQQIAGLERAVGEEVFERIGRTVRLTDAGRQLVLHAGELLAGLERAEVELRRARNEPYGILTVGVFESFALTLLGPILTMLAERYPALEVHTREYLPEDFEGEVQRGSLDAAIAVDYPHARVPPPAGLDSALLLVERFFAVVPNGHPLAPGPVALRQLESEALIGPPSSVGCGRCIELACHAAGFRPEVRHQLDDYPSSMRLVAQGHGVALLPGLALVDVEPGVEVLEVVEPVERELRLIHRTSSRDRPALTALLRATEDVVAELNRSQPLVVTV